jgi:hypothetical protein
MKFMSERTETKCALAKWAHPVKPYSASFFFWNQGFEMQKSQTGLLQSVVYQILRSIPEIIPLVCPERVEHERWEIDELRATLKRILSQPEGSLEAKFCIFIDGLDEYNGDEEDLVKILALFEDTPHLKLCVSSRPRHFLDEYYRNRRQTLFIHQFTKGDMETHVRQRLQLNGKFQTLQRDSQSACDELLKRIADQAQGVWLWVYLVTHDLVHAVNRNEDIHTLLHILSQFPPDLEAYFEDIIKRIKIGFREEMAQIFLITVVEVQPLPLFAFSLLEREKEDPNYAILAPIAPISDQEVETVDRSWRGRIQNRCGDLLVVSDGEHPTFLLHPVDFLHRTVRDFLRDCYYEKLQRELVSDFNPLISLCSTMLFFLKSLPPLNLRHGTSATRLIQIVDALLYYAHEAEKRDARPHPTLIGVLDEVDRVNSLHGRATDNHWTHVRDPPTTRGFDEYREGGQCNFLALAVQARLVQYVGAKLTSNPQRIRKRGRPLLDYALRPRRVTPISMPYHSQREDPVVDVDMVKLLLGAARTPTRWCTSTRAAQCGSSSCCRATRPRPATACRRRCRAPGPAPASS